MSKVLRIAAVVVAVAAITVATAGIGTAPAIGAATVTTASTTALGTTIAATAFTTTAVAATGASIFGISASALLAASSILSAVSGALAKPPTGSIGGSQTQWSADPTRGLPYAIGRTFVAGDLVHQASFGAQNIYQSFVTVYSAAGPVQSIDAFTVDGTTTTFSGGNATGGFHDFMYLTTQLGAQPESAALAPPFTGLPGWGSTAKLSGLSASIWTLKFDSKGKIFQGGLPKPGTVGHWVKAYDPRADSSYPGGSGTQRANDEASWAWTENPWLHALTWAIGRRANGRLTLGVGIPTDGIDVAAYVACANVAAANAWTCGGRVYSTDDKWNVIKMMAQAGGGVPIRQAARLSAFVNTPRISLATVTQGDLADGEVKLTAMQSRRDRINGVVPRYRSEAHQWEVVSGDAVRVSAYVTEDGGERTTERDFVLVQDGAQAAQLAAYEIVNAREFGPIEVPLKPAWMVYRVGDALTLNLPDAGLNNQLAVIVDRSLDPQTGIFTLTFRSETTAKHGFALGRTATPPPTPGISAPVIIPPAPAAGSWALAGASLSSGGSSLPALELTGAIDNPNADAIIVEFRKNGTTTWLAVGTYDAATTRKLISDGIAAGTSYQVAISNRVRGVIGTQLVLGPTTSGALTVAALPFGGEWAAGVDYVAGQYLTYLGSAYVVTTSHLSVSGSPPPNANVALFVTGGDTGSALVPFLTNESTTVAASSAGTVASFATAAGNFKVFDGSSDVSSTASFAVVSQAGVTMSIESGTGAYVPTAMAADTGVAVLRATIGSVTLDKVFTIAKSRAGVDGSTAKTLTLTSDRQLISYDGAGALAPASQTTTFTAIKQNSTATVGWTMTRADGAALTAGSYLSATTGDSVTMSAASFNTARGSTAGVIVKATISDGATISDQISVLKAGDGATGADGDAGRIYDPINYASVAEFVANWSTNATDKGISATADTGGSAFYFGNGSGDDSFTAYYTRRKLPYSPEDLYEIVFDIECSGSGTLNIGVITFDADGNYNGVSDDGSFHYFAGSVIPQTSGGFRRTFKGYFRGTAALGVGANVGLPASNPDAPNPCKTGTVSVAPALIGNYPNLPGQVILHEVTCRKVEDITVTPTGAWSSTRSYYRNEGATYQGRSFASRIDGNLNNTPPTTATSNGYWFLIADKGADGAPGSNGLTMSVSPTPISVAASANGTVKAGQLPRTVQVLLYQGSTNVTASATYSLTTSNCTVSNDGAGAFTVSALSADTGSFAITATYGGVSQLQSVSLTKVKDGSAASSAAVGVTTLSITGSYVAIATVELVVPTGAGISVLSDVIYQPNGPGNTTIVAQTKLAVTNVTDGGVPVDLSGSEQTGTIGRYIAADLSYEDGEAVSSGGTSNGTGATKTFRAALYSRKSSGTASSIHAVSGKLEIAAS